MDQANKIRVQQPANIINVITFQLDSTEAHFRPESRGLTYWKRRT